MNTSPPDIQSGRAGDGPALAPKDERRPETPSAEILDTFPAPDKHAYTAYTSDEMTALCPVTGQPDYYEVKILLSGGDKLIESKSLKFYLGSYRQVGMFCEALADQICTHVEKATGCEDVDVVVTQKSRGGISIKSASGSPAPVFPAGAP